jgi:hypothetical protein
MHHLGTLNRDPVLYARSDESQNGSDLLRGQGPAGIASKKPQGKYVHTTLHGQGLA